jgi:hypothetical protein
VRKGVRYLIEAFKKLSHPKKRLVLVGPNVNDGALNGLILTPDIVFTGVLKVKIWSRLIMRQIFFACHQ